jgi:hypothetical protein
MYLASSNKKIWSIKIDSLHIQSKKVGSLNPAKHVFCIQKKSNILPKKQKMQQFKKT